MDKQQHTSQFFSQQQLELILNSEKTGLWSWDMRSNKVRWSTGVENIFGLQPGTFGGTYDAYLELIPEDEQATLKAAIDNAIKSDGIYQIEHRIRLQDGSHRWVFGQGMVFHDNDGRPSNITGIVIDITAQRETEFHLLESEERFRIFTESTHEAICFIHEERILDCNPALGKLLDCPVSELVGNTIDEFIVPEDRERVCSKINSADRVQYEHRIQLKNGNIIFVEAYGKKLFYRGKSCWMMGLRDITAYKEAEIALRKNQQLVQSIIDHSPTLIFLKDTEGRYLLINKQFSELFNISAEQILGDTGACSMNPAIISNFQDSDMKVVNSKRPYEFEISVPDNGKGKRIFNAVKFPLFDGDGKVYAIGGIANDITDRKRAETVLHQRDRKIRDIVETSSDWFWATDENARFTYSNPAIEELLGYRQDEIAGRQSFDLIHPDDRERARNIFQEACANQAGWKNIHLRWKNKKGDYRILEGKSAPIIHVDGSLRGFRGTERDITERIRMEQDREKLELQLRQSQKMEAIGQLAGGIAHDFNNILTVILGHAELAGLVLDKETPNKNMLRNNLDEIQQSAQRAAVLTSQLLAFSRRQISQPESININHIILDMEKMLRRLITEDISLNLSTDPQLKSIMIDPNQLQQVIMNLVINSRDAITGNGMITIETENVELDQHFTSAHAGSHSGQNVRLSVTDTGCGMDNETIQRIFEPFFSTKPTGQGTGLGLSMVYGIIKQAHGYITVYSEPGNGTTVKIYFPVNDDLTTIAGTTPTSIEKSPGGTETILVCEDDDTVRKLTVKMLEDAGYKVLAAEHAAQALNLIQNRDEPTELLITDLIMPGMNGEELAVAVKELIPTIKTLYFSGYTANTISEHGIIAGDIEFLQKPFSRNELLTQVRRILDT